jgi:plastocyanin
VRAVIRPRLLVLGVLGILATAACSNSQSAINRNPHVGATTASVVNGNQQVTVYVDDRYRFDPSSITVHPGKVTITLVHRGTGAPHDFQVVGFPTDAVPLTAHGQTQSATFIAPSPGSYRFICTIHERQGQTGTLTVLPN